MDAKQIRELRARLKLTQAELAKRVPTTARTIRRWEHGLARPLPLYAERLRALAGLPAETHA